MVGSQRDVMVFSYHSDDRSIRKILLVVNDTNGDGTQCEPSPGEQIGLGVCALVSYVIFADAR
jgi:hypothetical protein